MLEVMLAPAHLERSVMSMYDVNFEVVKETILFLARFKNAGGMTEDRWPKYGRSDTLLRLWDQNGIRSTHNCTI